MGPGDEAPSPESCLLPAPWLFSGGEAAGCEGSGGGLWSLGSDFVIVVFFSAEAAGEKADG